MNGGEMMVVLIVLVAVVGKIVQARYRAADRIEGQPTQDSADTQRQREEIRALKERIAVLERLATDKEDSSARLDREIEKLRDRP
ncbi:MULTISPECIES: hypothetical protein [unclassified Sphingomonas]|uniref:hypothetical protein n=1 Tax=unclassified Sphingomonas TaxID=196159 RepID=UPI001F55EA6F|nr:MULTISPECIES: hypothetical protein [unclassified Sphingomonas]